MLHQAIARVIQYAAIYGQAVTEHDVLRYLEIEAEPNDVRRALREQAHRYWHVEGELYCLPGQDGLIAATRRSYARALPLWSRAIRWAGWIAQLPFVRMAAITGSLAVNNPEHDSDIDLLIVTAPGRLWLCRLFVVAVTRIAALRGDRLCPNYLLSESSLRLADQGFFTARELRQMVPIYGTDVYSRMSECNAWTRRYLPAANASPFGVPPVQLSRARRGVKRIFESILGGTFGFALERWEMNRKIARLSALPGAESPHVVLTADQCKGHFRREHRLRADQFAGDWTILE